jgi:hypothetical protein
MASTQLKNIGVQHDAIIDFLIANPAMKKSDVARHFGVSAPWLSVVIHSDVFQVKLKEKSQDVFDTVVVPLRDELLGVARVGVEKLGEAMEHASAVSDKEFIADTTDSILKNLGYSPRSAAPSPQPAAQVNVTVVDAGTLAAAREKMRAVPPLAPPIEHKEVVVDESSVPPAEEL